MKSLHQEWWSQLWSILCFSRSLKHPHQNLSNNAFLAPKLGCLSPLKDKGPGKCVQPLAASAVSSNLEIQGSRKQQTKLGWCISSFLLTEYTRTPNLPKNRHAYGLCLARRRPIWTGSKGSINKRGDKIKEESNNLDIPTAIESVYIVFAFSQCHGGLWEVLTFETGQDNSFHEASAWLISGVMKPTFRKRQCQKL